MTGIEGLTVAELMTTEPVVVDAEAPIVQAAQLLDAHGISGLPVIDQSGSLVGVLSKTDLVRVQATQNLWKGWAGLQVRHLMSSAPMTIGPQASAIEAASMMEEHRVHRLIVVARDGRTPVGVISTTDLVRGLAALARQAVEGGGR